jgi:hypothetical protein
LGIKRRTLDDEKEYDSQGGTLALDALMHAEKNLHVL